MNRTTLKKSMSKGVDGILYERHWQMEFYRVATSQLAPEHTISPDVGKVFGTTGFLDFYVDGGLKWAIELLREGDRAQEHSDRFKPDGRYKEMLANGHITKYVTS